MISPDEITAVILAGGQSERMGVNKALLKIKGISFVEKIVNVYTKIFSETIISSDNTDLYKFLKLRIIPDKYKNKGPIGGIHAGLKYSKRQYVFVSPCDVPFVSEEVVNTFLDIALPNQVSVAITDERLHPVFGIYPKSCIDLMDKFINDGKTKMQEYLDSYVRDYHTVDLSAYSFELKNINTQEEFKQILNNRN